MVRIIIQELQIPETASKIPNEKGRYDITITLSYVL
jgi:hypothetical protein